MPVTGFLSLYAWLLRLLFLQKAYDFPQPETHYASRQGIGKLIQLCHVIPDAVLVNVVVDIFLEFFLFFPELLLLLPVPSCHAFYLR